MVVCEGCFRADHVGCGSFRGRGWGGRLWSSVRSTLLEDACGAPVWFDRAMVDPAVKLQWRFLKRCAGSCPLHA
mgnify:CR=1 FL=1